MPLQSENSSFSVPAALASPQHDGSSSHQEEAEGEQVVVRRPPSQQSPTQFSTADKLAYSDITNSSSMPKPSHASKPCLANGFYSVGVGAPLAHTATAVSMELSPSLRFLEHLSMQISVVHGRAGKSRTGGKKQYAMTVHHAKTKASWRHCHSFEDYRVLHERLLELMEQGHFCMSECPYLYTFLQRSFPKAPHMVLSLGGLLVSERAIEERRFAIQRTLETLQSVLLNPNNHGCDVLTRAVATELVAFLYGEEMSPHQSNTTRLTTVASSSVVAASPVHPWEMVSPVGGATRGFSASIGAAEELEDEEDEEGTHTTTVDESSSSSSSSSTGPEQDDQDTHSTGKKICCSMCALQSHHPVAHVLATWRRRTKTPSSTTSTQKSTALKSRSSSVDTTALSQCDGTPRGSTQFAPPLVPENAILSPPRNYRLPSSSSSGVAKRFSLGETTVSMFHSLRQRVLAAHPAGTNSSAASYSA